MRVLIYNPQGENSIYLGEPEIGIHWPIDPERAVLSERDRNAQTLAQCWRRRRSDINWRVIST
jgi:dTDP-4-dehydrorhamnose 3,5-epimerase-like enzyme